tara:strand:- start:95 stop:769 length:675 start_codon:yes stop_codon:yes gene_type:complete
MKISVIIAAYNSEKFIGRCLRSLLNQTINYLPFSFYEIILINDGSTDKTDFAVNLFKKPNDNQLKIITNEKNIGLPASLNKGIKMAQGEFIVRVDSDDYVNVNFLSTLAFYLDSYKDVGAVACDYILVDRYENVIKMVSSESVPIACGIMFRRKNLVEVGMYDSKFRCMEEKELRIRFEEKYEVKHLNLPLYRYRRHENNMTNDKQQIREYDILLNQMHHNKNN